ncbi:ABC-type transporter, periplasmic subunit family 3 [Clostridium sp. DL-VIII]|uniref:ABC transporter substrate-binding protein n=1 Tax=Clostridium sp. DL-VIII TaxID=641107 RepID=UPI00023B0469|nr:ABC transporter substrate-binding protein [Clostridium sp. DL-VIII]EHJ00765.1 ABC-type transporter, periplasmic subunit family 3 [Clostridium sp. DL-VIII]
MKKILKKLSILIIAVNFIGIMLGSTAIADDSEAAVINGSIEKDRLQKIKEKGVINVDTPLNDISYFYRDTQTGKLSGIDADIIVEISKRLGIEKIEMKQVLFSDLLEILNTDDSVDIADGGIYITPKREEVVSFTQPLYKGSEVIIVPTFSRINFKDDLKNAVVGVEKGTVFVELAEKWKNDNQIRDIVIFKNTSELLNALNDKEIDAGIADSVIVKYSLLKDPNLRVRILKDYLPEIYGNVGIAVRKNDVTLLSAFNEKINEMRADGTLYAILVENGLDKSNMV